MKKMMESVDVGIIHPGLLEATTNRGGGIEEQHYGAGVELSKCLRVVVISPFYRHYNGSVLARNQLEIEEVYFPAVKNYPCKTATERYVAPFSAVLYSLLVSIRIVELVKKRAKVIIVTDSFTGLLPTCVARLLGMKVIFSEGNLWPWINLYSSPKRLSMAQKIMYSTKILAGRLVGYLCDMIRVQSDLIKKGMIRKGITEGKIVVIGVGICTDTFTPTHKSNFPYDGLRVGFIGRLTDEKGARLLLEVCKEAEREGANVRFVIMGGGSHEKDFRALKNVERVGQVPRDAIPRLLAQTHAVLFFQADLGVAEIEAMACGKAILAANVGEVPRLVNHMENGLLCDLNPSCYLESLKLLLTNPMLLAKLSDNARKTVMSNFSWSIIGQKWFDLVSKVIQTCSSRRSLR